MSENAQEVGDPAGRWRLGWIVGLAVPTWTAGLALALFLATAIRVILFPYPLSYAEGQLLDQALGLSRLEGIYPLDLSRPPWTVATYPPVFALMQAPLIMLFGPKFWIPRAISTAASLLSIVLIGLISKRLTRSPGAAAAAGALFCLGLANVSFGALARVDALAIALGLAALWRVVCGPAGGSVLLPAALLTAAAFTRQTAFICALAGSAVWLAAGGRIREAVRLAGWTLFLGAAVFALLNGPLTHGGFMLHVVRANVNQMIWQRALDAAQVVLWTAPLLCLASLYAVFDCAHALQTRAFFAVYLAAAVAAAGLIAKIGSDFNYCYEISIGLAIGGALAWSGLARTRKRAALACGLLCLQLVWMAHQERELWLPLWQAPQRYGRLLARLADEARRDSRPILGDQFMGLEVMSGRRLHLQPFGMKQLRDQGLWDQGPLLGEIRGRKFSFILLSSSRLAERWTPEALDEIRRAYAPEPAEVDQVLVYRPAGQPARRL